ncbi:hypothetical protein CS542_10015 [Pedobacter sp. IW39]|nr:hypothetical protein CS542_10015 [Pedobacter sp. IW39]
MILVTLTNCERKNAGRHWLRISGIKGAEPELTGLVDQLYPLQKCRSVRLVRRDYCVMPIFSFRQ